ncbi:PAS domain S-box-containing protein/diguanylate cyclase (GGDEF)-like protein [Luteibacter sp. OK325]|uniref:GGDEF domain-containing protein n=1 Tax=Luteibacter sp. OK325 TaxID=2135670 RepID=UPI000D380CE8|nr:sensor domain-containing diguanylate cyclase [Luteibacter sp. OK325]PTR34369.1 PAS domain S-box-containing protein/diguanylate cyclase (GGDEF)-like protein [Luteibacter sp. OK325]
MHEPLVSPSNPRREPSAIAKLRRRVRTSEDFLEQIGVLAGVGGWELDLATGTLRWTAQTCRIHEVPADHQPTLEEAIGYYAPAVRTVLEAAVLRGIEEGEGWDLELPMTTAKGRQIWVRAHGAVEQRKGKASRLIGAFQDITERRRDIDALIASERRFRSLFTYSLGLICTHDLDGRLLTVNPAACQSLGYSEAEMIGMQVGQLMTARDAAHVPEYLARINARGTDAGRLRFLARDGTQRVWQYHNMVDTHAGETQVLGHAQDITEQVLQEQRLREWSIRDALTGCYNRRFLAQHMESADSRTTWACVTLDLDKFKEINDTFGHQRGDEVLVAMATFFQRHVRAGDYVIRLGGDEFLVVLPNSAITEAHELAGRLAAGADAALCGFTAGCAAHVDGASVEATLAEADRALYTVRRRRRGES